MALLGMESNSLTTQLNKSLAGQFRAFPLVSRLSRMSSLGRWAPSKMMTVMMPLLGNFHPILMPKTGCPSGACELIPFPTAMVTGCKVVVKLKLVQGDTSR